MHTTQKIPASAAYRAQQAGPEAGSEGAAAPALEIDEEFERLLERRRTLFRAIRFVILAMFCIIFVAFMWKYILAVLIVLKVFSGGT